MQELLAQVFNEARSAWRFRWYGAATAWLVCLFGWAGVAWQPDIYEAQATVYVDTSSVLRPILGDQIIRPDVATQLTYVRQALLGREHLERVTRENALDLADVTPAEREAALATLRDAIDIDVTTSRGDNTIYNISYRNQLRETAIGVVATLLNSLVEGTLGANQRGTDTAERFLDARISEYENRLQQAEQTLADFKRRNADRLPGSQGGYFEKIRTQRDALESAKKSLRLSESKREQIRAQLNSESPVMPAGAGPELGPPANSLDARIRDYQSQLEKLLLQYTEKHPDVVAVREALARLESQRQAQLTAVGVNDPDQELSRLDANPIHQSLQIALNQIDVEIAGLQADIEDRTQELKKLQSLVDEVPEVEAELARLNRDYDVINQQYQSLTRSRETQSLSKKASDTDQVAFKVIDPPFAPFKPVAPPRLLMLAMVFFGSLGGAAALCWFIAQLKPVFRSTASLRDICGLPVLGAITEARDDRRTRRRRMAVLAFAGAIVALTGLFAAVAAVEVVGPGVHSVLRMV
jgi:polysaccharide chain length determinant protein (PEP-CTERM system associated)